MRLGTLNRSFLMKYDKTDLIATMNEHRSIDQFNQKLDRILQGLPPGGGKLTMEDRYTLALAKRTAQIDLSQQSKAQEKQRQRLEELAMLRLPHSRSLTLALLFKPGRISWIGLVVLVQLVLGSVFGNMSTYPHTTTPRSIVRVTPLASSFLIQSPEADPTWWKAQNSFGSGTHMALENPQPVPTPLAPPSKTVFPQDTTYLLTTPLLVKSPVKP